jgi:hypothetical protein
MRKPGVCPPGEGLGGGGGAAGGTYGAAGGTYGAAGGTYGAAFGGVADGAGYMETEDVGEAYATVGPSSMGSSLLTLPEQEGINSRNTIQRATDRCVRSGSSGIPEG